MDSETERGRAAVDRDLCKGCGLCVLYCPPGVLTVASELNRHGYHPAA